MKKTLKPVPEFKDESEERAFWKANDSTEYIEWSKAKRVVFLNLRPATSTSLEGTVTTLRKKIKSKCEN